MDTSWRFHVLPKMMVRLVDVFGPRPYFWKPGQFQGTAVVLKNCTVHFQRQIIHLKTMLPCLLEHPIMGMTYLKLVERAMYSASVLDIAVIVCILEAHMMGAPAKHFVEKSSPLFFQISCTQGILNSSRLSCSLLLRSLVYMYLSQLMRTFTNYLKYIVISS